MRRILISLRTILKFGIIIGLATFIILGVVKYLYKPIYKVTLNGEFVGYCAQKSKLQSKIDNYIESGDGKNPNIAFVEIETIPEYDLCLLKRGISTNDDEIYSKVISTGTIYYKYYAILEDNEEKLCVQDFSVAEAVVQGLKEKNSENSENIQIMEKYETELANFVTSEEAIASLYKEKKKNPVLPKVAKSSRTNKSFSTSLNISKSTVSLGISLIKPVTGTITSRFGAKSSIRSGAHTGLDISASTGTAIKAAQSGTVTFSGRKGSYGNLLVITHSNGVQTYYGHCSKLYKQEGQSVSQGETIAAVGSTGNSTGPHLHFEIRVNGVAYNPQNYVY